MVNPDTGKPVPPEDVRKGFEVEPGTFVMLGEYELTELEPEPSRNIEITRVVPRDAVPHAWFDRPYYLGPDDQAADYFALARALQEQESVAIANWVMRKQDYAGAVLPHDDYLMLVTLRHAGEVVSASALPAPAGRKPDEREVRMATQLVEALADELDISAFRDEYRDRVLELVQAKAAGKTIELKRYQPKAPEDTLGNLLRASIKTARERRVA
jgi:DNA end-binding protein Ku